MKSQKKKNLSHETAQNKEIICIWNSKHSDLEKNDLNKRFLWKRFFKVDSCCNFTKVLRTNTDTNTGRDIHVLWPHLKVLNRRIGVSLTPHAE